MRRLRRLEAYLPGLDGSDYRITSPRTDVYNCIAWVLGVDDQWWAPGEPGVLYWPESLPRDERVSTFLALFGSQGFEPCDDGEIEGGFEKIALFAEGETFTHVALQLETGRWTSKLGENCDIEHELDDLVRRRSPFADYRYGEVVGFMRRPRR